MVKLIHSGSIEGTGVEYEIHRATRYGLAAVAILYDNIIDWMNEETAKTGEKAPVLGRDLQVFCRLVCQGDIRGLTSEDEPVTPYYLPDSKAPKHVMMQALDRFMRTDIGVTDSLHDVWESVNGRLAPRHILPPEELKPAELENAFLGQGANATNTK